LLAGKFFCRLCQEAVARRRKGCFKRTEKEDGELEKAQETAGRMRVKVLPRR
jgi:hypothetical protein